MMGRALMTVGVMLALVGCTGDPAFGRSASLEVQSVSASGTIGGRSIDGLAYTGTRGTRTGDDGLFWTGRDSNRLELSACPLSDQVQLDPYGGGVIGFDDRGGPISDGSDGTLATTDCATRSMVICDDVGCATFSNDEIRMEIRDIDGLRHVIAHASNNNDNVSVELSFYEL